MPISAHVKRQWRGSRANYEFLVRQNSTDAWTRYSVIESDSTITEYFGTNQITETAGQILPVNSVVASIGEVSPNPYDRYLVGSDESGYQIYEYYLDSTSALNVHTKPFDERMGVRVKDRNMMNFVYVDNKLVTYDEVDCGDF